MDRPRLILASQSPRRRELLAGLGIALEIRPARTDESVLPGESPRAYVARVAREKARAVSGPVVLAADTAVVLGDAILGKPRDADDAARMLRALSGTRHEVLTAVCVRSADAAGVQEREALVATEVRFRALSDREIAWYVATGEPLDKAGGYALQGAGGALVDGVAGSVSGVVGLPLAESLALLADAGFPLPWSGP
ncbi:MAG TPA: Maf family protein [Anaeromyxobacter sp.]|nr:Maf family protein [Anaeromyxobacter sp.]